MRFCFERLFHFFLFLQSIKTRNIFAEPPRNFRDRSLFFTFLLKLSKVYQCNLPLKNKTEIPKFHFFSQSDFALTRKSEIVWNKFHHLKTRFWTLFFSRKITKWINFDLTTTHKLLQLVTHKRSHPMSPLEPMILND